MLTPDTPEFFPHSLWSRTAPPLDPHLRLDGELACDILIIGAGFTGIRAALALAEAGKSVVVTDSGDVGWGASGRTGGQVNPALPFVSPEALSRQVGPDFAERMAQTTVNSADEVFDLVRDYQIQCDARQSGWLRVDHCRKIARVSQSNAEGWAKYGSEYRIVEGDDLYRLTGTRSYRRGILTVRGGAIQPLSFVRGLARAAEAAGAQIFGQTAVIGLRREDGNWLAKTAQGRITARWIIVATNAYSGDLLPKLRRSIIPLAPIQIATDPLPASIVGNILPEGHTVSDTRRVIMYARREMDNRMVFGSLGRLNFKGEITGHGWLIRDAERVFPQLAGVDWTHRWGGRIALTDDRLPHLHEPKPRLLAGLGYNGRGVAMANVMGRVMAERVLGKDPDSLPFPITGITRVPFRGIQMIGKGIAISWMRLLDRLEMQMG